MLGWVLLGLFVVLVVVGWLLGPVVRRNQVLKRIPCFPGHFILGNAVRPDGFVEGPAGYRFLVRGSQSFRSLWALWLGPSAVVMPTKPEELLVLIKSEAPKAWTYQFGRDWLGEGLLLSNGAVWKKNRRILTPAFHFDALKEYIPIFAKNTQILLDEWAKIPDGNVDVQMEMSYISLDNIGETAFGTFFNAVQARNAPFVTATLECAKEVTFRSVSPLYFTDFMYRLTSSYRNFQKAIHVLDETGRQAIEKRKELLQQDGSKFKEKYFIDILLTSKDEDGNGLTEKAIRDETNTFMFEGHDTTSSGMMWTMYFISQHPTVEQEVLREVDEVLGDSDFPNTEQISKLKYLSRVIKESHRLIPPVPFLSRLTSEELELSGYKIPKNTMVAVAPLAIHMNPDTWPEPEKFDPDRFLPENSTNRHPYAYVPFSVGSRNCIGQKFAELEHKVVLSMIYKRFLPKLCAGQQIQPYIDLVTRNLTPLYMQMTPRHTH